MARLARVKLSIEVFENGAVINEITKDNTFSLGANLPSEDRVSLTGSAFTALSPPSGAKGAFIETGSNASLTIKGVTGDNGVAITPASNIWGGWAFIPLGSSPSIGIANAGSTAVVRVLWI